MRGARGPHSEKHFYRDLSGFPDSASRSPPSSPGPETPPTARPHPKPEKPAKEWGQGAPSQLPGLDGSH